jgi:hypothetical protein
MADIRRVLQKTVGVPTGLRSAAALLVLAGGLLPSVSGSARQTSPSIVEPVILDVKGNGISLTSPRDGVGFDLDGDGQRERVAWTQKGTDDAFLWVDLTRAGAVFRGSQLLGGLFGGLRGFDTLRAMDSDPGLLDFTRLPAAADARITSGDLAFERLIAWTDSNHNGVSEAPELASMAAMGVVELYYGYEQTKLVDSHGNRFTASAVALVCNEASVPVRTEMRSVRLAVESRD